MKTLLKYIFIVGLVLFGASGKLFAKTPSIGEEQKFSKYFNITHAFELEIENAVSSNVGYYNPSERDKDFNILIEEKYEEENDDDESHLFQVKLFYNQSFSINKFSCCLLDTYFQKRTIPSLQYVVEPISHRYILLENFRL